MHEEPKSDSEYRNVFLSRHRVIIELHEFETNLASSLTSEDTMTINETIETYYRMIEHLTQCMQVLYQDMVHKGLRMPQWEYDEAIYYEFLAHNVIS